jgi:Domain of unknown function (DUF4402)
MIKRNILLASAAALAVSALATGAVAGTLTANATSSVIVVSPTTLTKNQDLNFGTVIRPSGSSANTTFTLDPTTGTVTAGSTGDGTVVASPTTAAVFTLQTISAITYSQVAVLTFAPAGQLINIGASAPVVASTTGGTATQVPANGAVTLSYGGHFDVTPTTAPQTYTGTLAVTVTYN